MHLQHHAHVLGSSSSAAAAHNAPPTPRSRAWQQQQRRRRSCVVRAAASPAAGLSRGHVHQRLHDASADLTPYLLWDKAVTLQASYDARAHSQADVERLCEVLGDSALDKVSVGHAQSSSQQPLTVLAVACCKEDAHDVAAALLKWTPATHITASHCERCYLPTTTVAVTTPFGGPIDVHLSMAGSRVCKVTPAWEQCAALAEAAAAAGGQAGGSTHADAAAVAAAAVQQLHAGLEDGLIALHAQYLY